jgi:hypothetical protein
VEHIDATFAGTYRRGDGYELELGVIPGFWRCRPASRLSRSRRQDPAYVRVRWDPARWTIATKLDDAEGTRRERVLRLERGKLVEGPALEDDPTPLRSGEEVLD